MSEISKRLVVVLGMHRSGTSAIAKGLSALGVELGNTLLAPLEGNNPKGFIEDVDINALNIEMLHTLGSDWHRLTPIQSNDVQLLKNHGYMLRAIELLRKKSAAASVFGFKDPRVAKLLPFWTLVFKQLQFDVSFVLALRHPLSVVRSLEKRDNLDGAKVYLLWLGHVISSLYCTIGCSRIAVDYDRVLNAPGEELLRISRCLNLTINSTELRNYDETFLDKELRHTVFHLDDLLLDPNCPALVSDMWSALTEATTDRLNLDNVEFQATIKNWVREYNRLVPPLTYIDSILSEAHTLSQLVTEKEARITDCLQAGSERDSQIQTLSQTIESLILDRDAQKSGVTQLKDVSEKLLTERDLQAARVQMLEGELSLLAKHHEGLAQDHASLTRIHDALTQSHATLRQDHGTLTRNFSSLERHLASVSNDYEVKIEQLGAAIVTGRTNIDVLSNTVNALIIDRDAHQTEAALLRARCDELSAQVRNYAERLQSSSTELATVYQSKSWRVTAPLRKIVSALKGKKELIGTQLPIEAVAVSTADHKSALAKRPKHRILLVSHYCPTRAHAGGLRILDIYDMIRKNCPEAQLDILTYIRPDIDWSHDDLYDIFDNVYISQTEALSLQALKSLQSDPSHYEVIDLQFHQCGQYIDEYRNICDKILFTPMESLAKAEFIKLKTYLSSPRHIKLREIAASIRVVSEEIAYAAKADAVICVSRSDAAFLRIFAGSRKVRGMDTGVSRFEFSDAMRPDFVIIPPGERRCSILYIAYFGSDTNVKALMWYLDKVHPLIKRSVPGYVLTVAGRGDMSPFAGYKDSSIEFLGEVDALEPCIRKARVGIAPALSGSGLRGKVNQYAIEGVPSVVSPIAHKGLAYRDGETIFVAESPELFAERCVQLLTDMDLNAQMGQDARKLCIAKYSWASKWRTMQAIYALGGCETSA